ncbi:hypothetical protein B9G69_016565 [Bdellovibrio sp. SKB1291214]|uniref:hypothetical protein n=1 Tax=Bdellovibrio sp. SKB1291214 TaxID=1732569 RepID=UPI000B51C7B4|nr:hypothetical protein [Bdellovibrio sp. SKB1291214]UYL08657.1 hypothetical protein B9G69_016565 [Bdellovibrio sp. SKB1291214]
MKALILSSALVLMTTVASASGENCKALKAELIAMKDAQTQMMGSLVSNHETFASTLEEYSDNLVTSSGDAPKKAITKEMKASAKAFRTRGVQGKRMAEKLQEATGDLLSRVAECL